MCALHPLPADSQVKERDNGAVVAVLDLGDGLVPDHLGPPRLVQNLAGAVKDDERA